MKKLFSIILVVFLLASCSSVSASTLTRPSVSLREYEIQAGDTLEKISEKFNVSMSTLINRNDIENPDLIYAGDILLIPRSLPTLIIPPTWVGKPDTPETPDTPESEQPEAPETSETQKPEQPNSPETPDTLDTFEYLIVSGDTLSEIAETYNTTVKILAELNNISNINQIWVGEILLIPVTENQKPEQPEVPETPEVQEPQPEEPNTPDVETPKTPDVPTTPDDTEQLGRYEVESGDTYTSIAGKIDGKGGITSDILIEYNGDKTLFPGDIVIYPLNKVNTPSSNSGNSENSGSNTPNHSGVTGNYLVQPGDNYTKIAFIIDGNGGITSDILIEYNGDKTIYPGDVLVYPLSEANKTDI